MLNPEVQNFVYCSFGNLHNINYDRAITLIGAGITSLRFETEIENGSLDAEGDGEILCTIGVHSSITLHKVKLWAKNNLI